MSAKPDLLTTHTMDKITRLDKGFPTIPHTSDFSKNLESSMINHSRSTVLSTYFEINIIMEENINKEGNRKEENL